jgi:polysaccharide pyruvyl transferase WcaK-like protein
LVHGIDSEGKYLIGGLYHLYLLWLSKVKYNKPTFVVNHTVDTGNNEANEIIQQLYPKLDFVAVREKFSLRILKQMGIGNATFIPDALFTYTPKLNWKPSEELVKQIDFSKPYICIGDTSGFINNKYYRSVKWDISNIYSRIISQLKNITPQIIFIDGFRGTSKEINKLIKKNKMGFINLKNASYHDLYYVLKKADIFISGRWHASILSILAKTPIILLGADSHKTKALYEILDYDGDYFELHTLPIYIDELISSVKRTIIKKNEIKNHFQKKTESLSTLAKENVTHLGRFLKELEN